MLGNRQKMVRSLDFLAGSVTAWEALRHHPQQLRRLGLFDASAPTMIQEIGFAPDAPLEESGFEPSVPPRTERPPRGPAAIAVSREDLSLMRAPSWSFRFGDTRQPHS
jgi:pimeloyl-ACP methyl ester carboxylesterase